MTNHLPTIRQALAEAGVLANDAGEQLLYSDLHRADKACDALEAERTTLGLEAARREARLRELAVMFDVPDGGQYLNDWKQRLAALKAERDAAWNHCSTCGEMSGGGAYGCEECSEFLSEAGLTGKADMDRLEAERLTPEEAWELEKFDLSPGLRAKVERLAGGDA